MSVNRPQWLQEMIDEGYRAVKVRLPGLDYIVSQADCKAATHRLFMYAQTLARRALLALHPGATLESDAVQEKRKDEGWPRTVSQSQRLRMENTVYADAWTKYEHINPRDGEGWGMAVTVASRDERNHLLRFEASGYSSHAARMDISTWHLEVDTLEAMTALAADVFACGPEAPEWIH